MLEILNVLIFRFENLSLIFAMQYRWFENAFETKWIKTGLMFFFSYVVPLTGL
jgi:hypothetical protein